MILNEISNFFINKNEWSIVDLRIDIPDLGPGSDAINRHTQYSNPIAIVKKNNIDGIGAGFTLGLGNNLICGAIDDILDLWNGATLRDIAHKNSTNVYDILSNPNQIRWLSPNSGVNYQAVGVIVNTIIDWICKDKNMPAWQIFMEVTKSEFLDFYDCPINLSHVMSEDDYLFDKQKIKLDYENIAIKAYHTTWIGSSVKELSEEIISINHKKGIDLFKLKVGKNPNIFINKIIELKSILPSNIQLCSDANQTMDINSAKKFISAADQLNIQWLEEPFAPDNIDAFKKLLEHRNTNNLKIEIVTGENCPSPHVAASLMELGIDRFQADPCRMMGFIDVLLISQIGRFFNVPITPHAGGSCLDELSIQISFYDQLQNRFNLKKALVENVGFCSHFMRFPTIVKNGMILPPTEPGFLVGFNKKVTLKFRDYKQGITWLKL